MLAECGSVCVFCGGCTSSTVIQTLRSPSPRTDIDGTIERGVITTEIVRDLPSLKSLASCLNSRD